jgi:hypothetical protein
LHCNSIKLEHLHAATLSDSCQAISLQEEKELKIITNQQIGTHPTIPKSAAQEKSEPHGFKEILTQTLDISAPAKMSVPDLQELCRSSSICARPVLQPGKANLLERVENLVDLMDEYRLQIEDPQATLKDISPLVQAMQAEQEKMEPILTQLGEDDDLGGILKQALFTATMEVIKFNSGRYNHA